MRFPPQLRIKIVEPRKIVTLQIWLPAGEAPTISSRLVLFRYSPLEARAAAVY
jgi:hypothetical protein